MVRVVMNIKDEIGRTNVIMFSLLADIIVVLGLLLSFPDLTLIGLILLITIPLLLWVFFILWINQYVLKSQNVKLKSSATNKHISGTIVTLFGDVECFTIHLKPFQPDFQALTDESKALIKAKNEEIKKEILNVKNLVTKIA